MKHHRTLRQSLRELPRPVWLLVSGAFINQFASFAAVFLVLYLRGKGYSIAESGAAVAAYGLGEFGAALLGGHLADRIGRRFTIVVSMVASAAVMLALSRVSSYAGLMGLATAAGLSAEMYRPAAAAMLTDLVPEGRRVPAFALYRFTCNAGIAIGAAFAGFLADHSFTLVFLSDAATSAVFGLIAFTSLPGRQQATPSRSHTVTEGYRSILADRGFFLFLGATVVAAFVYSQSHATLPLHVRQAGLSNGDLGLLLSLNAALIVFLELPVSSFTMRLPPRETFAAGVALVGLGFGLTMFAHSMAALAGTVAVWRLGEMIAAPVGSAYVADIAPEDQRGRYQGLFGLSWGAGSVFGPAIGAYVFMRNAQGFWGLCGVMGCAAALMVLVHRRDWRYRRGLWEPGMRSLRPFGAPTDAVSSPTDPEWGPADLVPVGAGAQQRMPGPAERGRAPSPVAARAVRRHWARRRPSRPPVGVYILGPQGSNGYGRAKDNGHGAGPAATSHDAPGHAPPPLPASADPIPAPPEARALPELAKPERELGELQVEGARQEERIKALAARLDELAGKLDPGAAAPPGDSPTKGPGPSP